MSMTTPKPDKPIAVKPRPRYSSRLRKCESKKIGVGSKKVGVGKSHNATHQKRIAPDHYRFSIFGFKARVKLDHGCECTHHGNLMLTEVVMACSITHSD